MRFPSILFPMHKGGLLTPIFHSFEIKSLPPPRHLVAVSVGSRRCHPLPALRNKDRNHHRHGCSDPSTSANAVVVSCNQFLVRRWPRPAMPWTCTTRCSRLGSIPLAASVGRALLSSLRSMHSKTTRGCLAIGVLS